MFQHKQEKVYSPSKKKIDVVRMLLLLFIVFFLCVCTGCSQVEVSSHLIDVAALPDESVKNRSESEDVRTVTPQMFGALGDGISDDTKAFLLMNAYCNERPGTCVEIPPGHYIILEPLCFTENVTIRGSGQNTFLDFTGIKDRDGCAIQILGSYQELTPLQSPLKAGRNTLIYKKTPELNRGDIVAILDPTDYSWSSGRPYYRKGEFCEVFESDKDKVEFVHNINDNYEEGCRFLLMEMVQCEVTGFQISVCDRGEKIGLVPLELRCVKNSFVKDVSAQGSNYIQINLKSCYNVVLDHVRADYICDVEFGLNYGVTISNSQFISIKNSTMSALRHGMAIGGGGEGACIINRFIDISDSIISGRVITGADIHSISQYVRYDRCNIFNGIDFGGSDITFSNCNIYTDRETRWALSPRLLNGNLNITGNHFYVTNQDATAYADSLFSITLPTDEQYAATGIIRIDNNVFEWCGKNAVQISSAGCANSCTVVISNNVFKSGSILLKNFYNIIIDGNILQSPLRIEDDKDPSYSSTESIIFTNNTVYNIESDGLKIGAPFYYPALVNVSGNTFSNIRGTAINIEEYEKLSIAMNDNTFAACDVESSVGQRENTKSIQ